MSSYSFTVKNPPLLKDTGVEFIIHHPEVHDKMRSYKLTFDFTNIDDLLPNLYHPFGLTPNAYVTLKRQYKWKKVFGPETLAGEETRTIRETISQSLTESRSLRALIRVASKAEVNAPFASASVELTAEIEGTIEKQETWTKETEETYSKTLQPHRTYVFWSLVDEMTMIYHLGDLISYYRAFKDDKRAKAEVARLEKLNGSAKQFDTMLYDIYEDSMDADKALLGALASNF
jgi:hypothetical protein